MHQIVFYKDEKGNSPITDFLDKLSAKDAQKITWVLRLIEEHDIVPKTYFKKLTGYGNLWEVRAQSSNSAYRFLCFQQKNRIIVLTNGFQKKTNKTPINEIQLALRRKADWIERNKR